MCQCDRHNRTSGVIWLTPLLVLPVFYRKWYPWYLLFYRCHSEPLELYLNFRGIFTHYFLLVYYHFLMRYAMQVRPLAVMRCPSVYLPLCLSRWYMHFVKTNKHFHFFHLWAGGRPHYDITRKMLFLEPSPPLITLHNSFITLANPPSISDTVNILWHRNQQNIVWKKHHLIRA